MRCLQTVVTVLFSSGPLECSEPQSHHVLSSFPKDTPWSANSAFLITAWLWKKSLSIWVRAQTLCLMTTVIPSSPSGIFSATVNLTSSFIPVLTGVLVFSPFPYCSIPVCILLLPESSQEDTPTGPQAARVQLREEAARWIPFSGTKTTFLHRHRRQRSPLWRYWKTQAPKWWGKQCPVSSGLMCFMLLPVRPNPPPRSFLV